MKAAVVALALTVLVGPSSANADTVLRLGTVVPEGSRYYEDLVGFADDVERLSDGALKIKWIWGGALGDDAEMAKLVKAGKLDGGALTDVGLLYLVDEMVAWNYPGLFEDYAEVDYIEKRFKKRFAELFNAHGMQLVLFGDIGFLHIFSDEPVATLDDLRKQTLWLWTGDHTLSYSTKLLGIATEHSTLAGLVAGLESGRFETFQFPPLAAIVWGIHKHPKYVSELRIRLMTGAFVLRKDRFDELPADQRRLLMSLGRKWERRIVKSWRAESQKAIEVMVKGGMKFAKIDEKARQTFFQVALEHQPEFAEHYGVEELMGEMIESLRRFREARSTR